MNAKDREGIREWFDTHCRGCVWFCMGCRGSGEEIIGCTGSSEEIAKCKEERDGR